MDHGSSDVGDAEQKLLEDACTYLTTNSYPAHVTTKNEKRSVRRKASKLVINDDGQLCYKKKGKEVNGYYYFIVAKSLDNCFFCWMQY